MCLRNFLISIDVNMYIFILGYNFEFLRDRMNTKLVITAVSSLFLMACGGGSNATTPSSPANSLPVVVVDNDIEIFEGEVVDIQFSATDANNDPVSFSLTGDDAAHFSLSNNAITFNQGVDFENPTDTNLDNVYTINLVASDGIGSVIESINLTIQDAFEGRIVDGPVFGSKVFFDKNNNFVQDANENVYLSDESGYFSVLETNTFEFNLVAIGGIDTVTNQSIDETVLAFPPIENQTFANVTPLSTLVTVSDAATVEQLLSAVSDGLTLDQVLSRDTWQQAENNESSAQAIQTVNSQIIAVVNSISKLTNKDNITTSKNVIDALVSGQNNAVLSTLNEVTTITNVINEIAANDTSIAPVNNSVASALSQIIATTNNVIRKNQTNITSGALSEVIAASQSSLPEKVAALVAGNITVEEFSEETNQAVVLDTDNDGVLDANDAFPFDPTETLDTDQDGMGNNTDTDDDNDGVLDAADAFPLNRDESLDTDKDGLGNNADTDDDNDGVLDAADAFPLNRDESLDTDKDGLGNNADTDDDNDGVLDAADAFPLNRDESLDTDKDGLGNNADTDDDNDGVLDAADAFPLNRDESLDTDKDGLGNNADTDDDNDGVLDAEDAFPLDKTETIDTDQDGLGNNADDDDDGDGIPDSEDSFPLDPNFAPKMLSNFYVVEEDTKLNSSIDATDQDGDSLMYTLISNVSNGSLNFSTDGSFEYIPDINFYGEDSFSASASDGDLSSEIVIFNIQITGINDAPSLQNISIETRLDNSITLFLYGKDVDSEKLDYSVIAPPSMGSATIGDNNTIIYTPNQGAIGIDEFKIQVSDGELTSSAIATVDNNLSFKGSIDGNFEDAEILLTGDGYLLTTIPDSLGNFKFYGLADGDYAVKVRKDGYKSSAASTFTLDINEMEQTQTNVTYLDKTQQSEVTKALVSSSIDNKEFSLVAIDSENFSFHWEEDQSTAGFDYSAYINEPLTIEFLGEQQIIVNDSSANLLHHNLNILLVDSGDVKWTQEHAYRIAEIMKSIPQEQRDSYQIQSLKPSKWQLTSDYIENDIRITETSGHKTVLISDAVFVNAAPKVAKVEGKRGVFYSQRLHHALVRFVTQNGTDVTAYEKILNERYGVSTLIPDYSILTAPTGNEGAGRFQAFHPDEIVEIINMFEEMPKGMHKLPELNYLVRRLDGTPHPFYDEAPAVAWSDAGYIEFMESAFNTSSVAYMHRLIIHEKAHFLWAHQFDRNLKDDWVELGGWYEDSSTNSGWATSNQTEFVSAYAHSKNPNEDMAESISYFIINPDLLKSRAIRKYEFVRDRIMQGNIYISQINENLTFQVYNLFPDYVFPGKIKRVDINVDGIPEQDKIVTIDIELHALDVELEGAKLAYLRVFSEIGTYKDVYLYPVDANGIQVVSGDLSTRLQGSFTLSKFAKAGFWRTEQIVITDSVGNQRMEGANDFGWKLHVNNPLEDAIKPEYVSNTASLTKSTDELEGQEVQIIHASWLVNENKLMSENSPCYASMNDEILSTYRVEGYGSYDEFNETCSVDFLMPHYMPSSNYSLNYIKMFDLALNQRGTYFTNSSGGLRDEDINLDEFPQQIELVTDNQDIIHPELDLNDIQIVATPTNPDAPNGETIVTVTFHVRDNISGYNIASLILRDPQGIEHQYWVYNDETWSIFPKGDVTQWTTYTRNIVLPVGSAPGTWGVSEITIYDRAGNFKGYDFTEIVHFDVIE